MDHQPSQLPAHTLRSLTRSLNDLGKAMATPFAATAVSVNLAAQRLAHALGAHSPAAQVYTRLPKRLYTCCGQQRIDAAADCVEVECPTVSPLPAPYLLYSQCPDCGCMCLTLPVPAATLAYNDVVRRVAADGTITTGATKPHLLQPSYRRPRTAPLLRVPAHEPAHVHAHVPDHRSQR